MQVTLIDLLIKTGFVIPEENITLQNLALPVLDSLILSKEKEIINLPTNAFKPWEINRNISEKFTLIYFWAPECAPCKDGIQALGQLLIESKIPDKLQIWPVVSENELTRAIKDELQNWNYSGHVFLDTTGGLSEKLGVVAVPACYFFNPTGKLIAYFNGEIDFNSPEFETLISFIQKKTYAELNSENEMVTSEAKVPQTALQFTDKVNWQESTIALIVLVLCIFWFVKVLRQK